MTNVIIEYQLSFLLYHEGLHVRIVEGRTQSLLLEGWQFYPVVGLEDLEFSVYFVVKAHVLIVAHEIVK